MVKVAFSKQFPAPHVDSLRLISLSIIVNSKRTSKKKSIKNHLKFQNFYVPQPHDQSQLTILGGAIEQ